MHPLYSACALALVPFCLLACKPKEIPARVTAEAVEADARASEAAEAAEREAITKLLVGGELHFALDFDSPGVLKRLTAERLDDEPKPSTWRVDGGWLRNDDARNQGLWIQALPDSKAAVRIEFEARSVKPPAGRAFPGDIKCEAFASSPNHESGYSFINGGWSNRFDIIARLGEHSADDRRSDARPVAEGVTYCFAILRLEDRLHWLRDGELLYTFVDPEPLKGTWFGFNNWLSDVAYRSLRVYVL